MKLNNLKHYIEELVYQKMNFICGESRNNLSFYKVLRPPACLKIKPKALLSQLFFNLLMKIKKLIIKF